MQFVRLYKDQYLSEETQDRPCKFSFALRKEDVWSIMSPPALCRDFLNDTLVWKAKEAKKDEIYGWDYAGKICRSATRLVIIDWYSKGLLTNIEFLNKLEEEVGVKPTEVVNDGIYFGITGDPIWMTTTVHMSFYTYLLRQMSYSHPISDYADLKHDDFVRNHPTLLENFSKLLKSIFYLEKISVSGAANLSSLDPTDMHNYNGFGSQVKYPQFTVYGKQLNALLEA